MPLFYIVSSIFSRSFPKITFLKEKHIIFSMGALLPNSLQQNYIACLSTHLSPEYMSGTNRSYERRGFLPWLLTIITHNQFTCQPQGPQQFLHFMLSLLEHPSSWWCIWHQLCKIKPASSSETQNFVAQFTTPGEQVIFVESKNSV